MFPACRQSVSLQPRFPYYRRQQKGEKMKLENEKIIVWIVILTLCVAFWVAIIMAVGNIVDKKIISIEEKIEDCIVRANVAGERTDELWEEIF